MKLILDKAYSSQTAGPEDIVLKPHYVVDEQLPAVQKYLTDKGYRFNVSDFNAILPSDEKQPLENAFHIDYGGMLHSDTEATVIEVRGYEISFYPHTLDMVLNQINHCFEKPRPGFCKIGSAWPFGKLFCASEDFFRELRAKINGSYNQHREAADQQLSRRTETYKELAASPYLAMTPPKSKLEA